MIYLTDPPKVIHCCAFLPDGRGLVLGGSDPHVQWRELPEGKLIGSRDVPAGYGSTKALAVSPEMDLIALGIGNYDSLRVFRWADFWGDDESARACLAPWNQSRGMWTPQCNGLTFSPDGEHLAAVYGDWGYFMQGHLHVWNVKEREEIWDHRVMWDSMLSVCYSPDGQRLAVGTGYDGLVLRDATKKRIRGRMKQKNAVRALAFDSEGTRLVSANGHSLSVWDVRSKTEPAKLKEHKTFIASLAMSPDGTRLLSGDRQSKVCLWDMEDYNKIAAYDWEIGRINQVAFSPDGMLACAVGEDGPPVIWDVD